MSRRCKPRTSRNRVDVPIPLAWLCATLAASSASPDVAGQTPGVAELERAIVTGSHIRQIDAEGALPVQVITREEIERTGATTTEQLLSRVAANVNAINAALSVGETTRPGLAGVNLRGLGGGSTLVLLNGRRLANYAFDGETVDLASIPLGAIDRVEILKDGASAIYGSDAVAGIVNVILRKDLEGAQFEGDLAVPQHGGGKAGRLSLMLGAGNPARDGFNGFVLFTYQKQQRLAAADRDFARTASRPDIGLDGLNGATFPANIVDRPRQRILNPAEPSGCAPPASLPARPFPFETPACSFDVATATDLLPEAEHASAMLNGHWRATGALDLYAEALFARNRYATRAPPMAVVPLASVFGQPIYPAAGPYYPSAFAAANGLSGDLVLAYRPAELGPSLNTTTNNAQRYVLGGEARLRDWDLNLAAVYSANAQELEYDGGWLSLGRFIPALRTGLINPFGPSAPEGQALLASTAFRGTPQAADASTTQVKVFASREIDAMPAGRIAFALGAEAREERLAYEWDTAASTGFVLADRVAQTLSGSRRAYALFTELKVPIARRLDAQLAVRFDDYDDVGSTTNPKVAVRWQPLEDLLVRGAWGTGFRAPPLYALSAPPGATRLEAGLRDPVRCPVTGALDDCRVVVQAYAGGNPDLQPETSEQRTLGVVLQANGFSVAIDYWDIEQRGAIAPLAAEDLLANQSLFAHRIVRGPVDPRFPALPGPILGMNLSPINLGTTRTNGVDVALVMKAQRWRQARVSSSMQGTYVMRYDAQIDGVNFVSLLGSAVRGEAIPRWRSAATLDLSGDTWGVTLAHVYSRGYVDQFPGADGAPRKVAANAVWDLQARYGQASRGSISVGIQNLFDRDPPSSNQLRTAQVGYNPRVASPLGRTFYVRAVYAL